MAGNTSSGTPAMPQDGAGASNEVSGAAEMVSAEDVRALQSKLDKQIAEQNKLIQQMQAEKRNQQQAQLADMSPTEQAQAYKARLDQYERQEQELQARNAYAATVAASVGVDPSAISNINDPAEMLRVATEARVQAELAASVTQSAGTTLPPASGGATLIEPEIDKTVDEVRANAFESGDRDAFLASFMNPTGE